MGARYSDEGGSPDEWKDALSDFERMQAMNRLNRELHALVGVDRPCGQTCRHVLAGDWTVLAAALVLAANEPRRG